MAVVCPICKFDNPSEETIVCEQCGFDFMTDSDGAYSRALKMLKDTEESLSSSVGNMSKEKLEGVFEHISAQIQEAVEQSREDFNASMQKFSGLSAEQLDALPDGDVWKGFLNNFDYFKNQINDGISMACSALNNMRDFNNLKTGKSQLELAQSQIQLAFESMQMYTASLLSGNVTELPPVDITLTMENLNKAVEYIGYYLSSKDFRYLNEALPLIENAGGNLRFALEQYYEEGQQGFSETDE